VKLMGKCKKCGYELEYNAKRCPLCYTQVSIHKVPSKHGFTKMDKQR
jgi:predicted Zn-ribbon and HTH transcriptional regulator